MELSKDFNHLTFAAELVSWTALGVWNNKLSPLNDHGLLSDLSPPPCSVRPLSGVLLGARNFSDNLESEPGLTTDVSHFSPLTIGDGSSGVTSIEWADRLASLTQLSRSKKILLHLSRCLGSARLVYYWVHGGRGWKWLTRIDYMSVFV